MGDQNKIDNLDEEAHMIASGEVKPAEKEMEWKAFWKLPRPEVTEEAMKDAIPWAKSSSVDRLIDRMTLESPSAKPADDSFIQG